MKRGFLNTTRGKKTIEREPDNPTPKKSTLSPPASAGLKSPPIKLPFGKVDDIEIDKEYAYENRNFKEVQPTKGDLPDYAISITTIPPKHLDGRPNDPDGHTEWLVKGNTNKKVLNTPGHPRPIPKPLHLNYAIKTTPNMGMGVFAIRDISAGELIFSERPLLIYPRNVNLDYNVPKHYSPEQVQKVVLIETEKKLDRMLSRMNEEARNGYLGLTNNHKEDGSGPLVGIMRTNAFGVGVLVDGPKGTPMTAENGYMAVCKLASRINHSCIPNVESKFDPVPFSIQLVAVTDIKAGEQITYSYCMRADQAPKAKRKQQLVPWGIICTCPACQSEN